jgi:hypothetical protein
MCHIVPPEEQGVIVVSLTHVRVPRTMPLAAAVADYRKHRVKKPRARRRPGARSGLQPRFRAFGIADAPYFARMGHRSERERRISSPPVPKTEGTASGSWAFQPYRNDLGASALPFRVTCAQTRASLTYRKEACHGHNPRPAMATARDGQQGAQSADLEADEARYDDRRVHRPGTMRENSKVSVAKKQMSRRASPAGGIPVRYIAPQLCELVTTPPVGDKWVHEAKLDGYRIQLHVRAGKAILYSRKGPRPRAQWQAG